MQYRTQLTTASLAGALASCLLLGQVPSPDSGAGGRAARVPPPPVRSPEVNPDRTVTFRLRAPQASAVELVGEVLQGKGPQEMTKDADGIWSVTIGPLPPEIWIYN